MELVLRVYYGTQIKEIKVADGSVYTVGSGQKDHVQLADAAIRKGAYQVQVDSAAWHLTDKAKKSTQQLQFNKICVLDYETQFAVCVYQTSDVPVVVDLTDEDQLMIGRSTQCQICVQDKQISGQHLELRRKGANWEFRDMDSVNGTYHNGILRSGGTLAPKDVLTVGHCTILFSGASLYVHYFADVKLNVQEKQGSKTANDFDDEYPYLFKQSPRLIEEVPQERVELQSPPNIGGKPAINWISVILTPILTTSVMVMVGYFVLKNINMLFYSVPSALIGVMMGIARYQSDKKKYRQTERLRIEKYGEYLREQIEHLEKLSYTQRAVLENATPSAANCVKKAVTMDRALWDRRVRDSDFLLLRVGSGTLPAGFSVQAPKQMLTLETDLLAEQPSQIVERFSTVDECPICMDLGEALSCGIIGARAKCVTEGKNLILQAASHLSYDDLRIVVLYDHREAEEWEFCKWLPHCWDDTRSMRYIAGDPRQATRLLEHLEGVISSRSNESDSRAYGMAAMQKPFYLFVCATPDPVVNNPVMKYLAANDPALGIGAIYLFDRMGELPKDCHYIIDFTGTSNQLYERKHASHKQKFKIDTLEEDQYEVFARSLAPLRVEAGGSDSDLPVAISFLQGYRVTTPQELPVRSNWENAFPEKSMAVPIGVRAGGGQFLFDIHEKQHGPHGLVAGTTGYGKSEMVQSWILSMAVRFPPESVSFVLIDFKGTGLLTPFRRLPHLAGCISDLDTSIGRNLIALENELTRRKALFDSHQVSNISSYLRLLREGKATQPLSYLFIVIDEFAEVKGRFPDFMTAVNRVFAIGRTLGVHMILSTQKPANVVDDKMNANARFRWCLKVANSADSREMLRHTDAAKITNPGRAYVQVGEDEVYEQIQSYWSGAPYDPYRDLSVHRSEKVSVVGLYGERTCYEADKASGYQTEKNEINAIVDHLDEYCRQNGIAKAKQLWTTKLPTELKLSEIVKAGFDGTRWEKTETTICPAVGLVDDPRTQSQYPLLLNFREDGHCAIYGAPGTGKTTALHTAVMSIALSYSPDQVHMYMMDFGGGSLNLFRDLPHVGGVVLSDDETRMEKLTVMLMEELERRKKLISEQGLVNIASYCEATGQPMPYIVLLLDNFAPVLDMYPTLDGFFQTLVRDGSSYGIYFLVTANTQNTLSFRISQHMKAALCLRMPDKGDYAPIVGRTNGLEPENVPGRGLLKGNPPLEFQFALPANSGNEIRRVDEIRRMTKQMREQWDGAGAPAIPVMPDTVRCKDYPTKDILCGLYTQTVQPCTVDLGQSQYLLVSNADGTETIKHLILKQTVQKLAPEKIIACGEGSMDAVQMLSAQDFDVQIEALMPELQKRKVTAAGQRLDPSQWPYILVYIDHLKSCIDAINDQTLRRLSNIVTLGSGLNVLVIAESAATELTSLFHAGEAFTMNMLKKASAILLGGKANDHMAVKTDLPFSAASVAVDTAEGYLVVNGHAERMKVVQS